MSHTRPPNLCQCARLWHVWGRREGGRQTSRRVIPSPRAHPPLISRQSSHRSTEKATTKKKKHKIKYLVETHRKNRTHMVGNNTVVERRPPAYTRRPSGGNLCTVFEPYNLKGFSKKKRSTSAHRCVLHRRFTTRAIRKHFCCWVLFASAFAFAWLSCLRCSSDDHTKLSDTPKVYKNTMQKNKESG